MEHRRHASPTGSVPPARSPRAAINCTPVSQTQERRRCGTTTDPSPCGSYLIAAPLNSAESSIQHPNHAAPRGHCREGSGRIPHRDPRCAPEAAAGLLRSGSRPAGRAARKVSESAKRARLLALLEELVAERRKVLLFSQFVKMLKLVERDIAARGWGYAMLHGRTKDRDIHPVGGPAADSRQPEGWRHGPQPDRGRHRHRLRSVVEPGGGTAGHGPGAPDRSGQAGIRSSPDRRKHRRGLHSADAVPQAGPRRRLVRRNEPGSADTHGRGHPGTVRSCMIGGCTDAELPNAGNKDDVGIFGVAGRCGAGLVYARPK